MTRLLVALSLLLLAAPRTARAEAPEIERVLIATAVGGAVVYGGIMVGFVVNDAVASRHSKAYGVVEGVFNTAGALVMAGLVYNDLSDQTPGDNRQAVVVAAGLAVLHGVLAVHGFRSATRHRSRATTIVPTVSSDGGALFVTRRF